MSQCGLKTRSGISESPASISEEWPVKLCVTSILKVLLKQNMSPTGPNKYLRDITPTKTDKPKLDLF